jgi:hypothetical protein
MKRHKRFRTAISVSVQERKELFLEMTDDDIVKALKILAGELLEDGAKRKRAESPARMDDALAKYQAQPHSHKLATKAEWLQREAQRREQLRRLQEEGAKRAAEREAQRELSRRMIDIGYKVLAKELHPDKGGNAEMMARLNSARKHQKLMA